MSGGRHGDIQGHATRVMTGRSQLQGGQPVILFSGRIVDWLQVIRGEFNESPRLSLTMEQAHTRWPLPAAHLAAILGAFEDVRFLRRLPDGSFVRRDDWSDG
jgi:hypothetical protein